MVNTNPRVPLAPKALFSLESEGFLFGKHKKKPLRKYKNEDKEEKPMAKVTTNVHESVYQIKQWKGVNEAQEGEASLEMGEAAVMRNFKVTAGGALQKRGGSVNVAGLLNSYTVEVDEDNPQVLFTENGSSTLSLTLYPGAQATSMGVVEVTGSPVTVTEENADSYEGYYYKDEAGAVYRFEGVARSRV